MNEFLPKNSLINRPDTAIERYVVALKAGQPVPLGLVQELKTAGHVALAGDALRQLAASGDNQAKAETLLQSFAGLFAWLSPAASTRQKIARIRVPGMVFDIGPDGFAGWYSSMMKEIEIVAAETIRAIVNLTIIYAIFVAMPEWSYGYANSTLLKIAIFLLWLPSPAHIAWHWEVARVYAAEWDRLEVHGPEWHFENGAWFRFVFVRLDGSYKIDPRTRQDRVDQEIESVRTRGPQLAQAAKATLSGLFRIVVFYVILSLVFRYAPWSQLWAWMQHWDWLQQWHPETWNLQKWNLPLILTALNVGEALPTSAIQWLRLAIDKWSYEKGKQFIPVPRVFDPVPSPLTLETVKEQTALGDERRVKPREASRKMRS